MRSRKLLRFHSFSEDRVYRYVLWREWNELFPICKDSKGDQFAMFIGLNPSTADETADDPTLRRCIAFARAWGYGALCMTNLFAFRATDPLDMMAAPDPIGEGNNEALKRCHAEASVCVAAWGIGGKHMDRDKAVCAMLPALQCLRRTKDGSPAHPLYLPANLTPHSMTLTPEIAGGANAAST
jgi:hypothetical protein